MIAHKEKGLDFLGFLWPNLGFSMGYGEKNKKNLATLNSPTGLCLNCFFLSLSLQTARSAESGSVNINT
jgi:hypothetical protein